MCGNRLKDWNTIPICRRIAFDVDAARRDLPPSIDDPAGVDRLEEVDAPQERRLARAGRADQADDLVLARPRSIPRSTSSFPKACGARRRRIASVTAPLPPAASARCRATSQSVTGQRDRDEQEQSAAPSTGVKLNVAAWSICASQERLGQRRPRRDERGVLLQADEVVQERRDHAPDRLRDHDEAQRLPPASPSERAAAAWLGCTDSIPAR